MECRSPSRLSQTARTVQQDVPGIPPVNAQSWAAANSHATKSHRYQKLAGLHLAPNVAIRPDHGCAWDIHDGTNNILISDDAVDSRALQVCTKSDHSVVSDRAQTGTTFRALYLEIVLSPMVQMSWFHVMWHVTGTVDSCFKPQGSESVGSKQDSKKYTLDEEIQSIPVQVLS